LKKKRVGVKNLWGLFLPQKNYLILIQKKQGDGSLFANPRLPLTRNTFIRMVFIPG